MLSLDQCKNLALWGMPQDNPVRCYDYCRDMGTGKPEVEYGMVLWQVWDGLICNSGCHNWDSDWMPPSDHAVKCPDLQEMIEWGAKDLATNISVLYDWHTGMWTAEAHGFEVSVKTYGNTPKQAVYALIEKLREERNDG